jgi:hypothetical protein
MRWKCACGHEWTTTSGNVRNLGSWCLICSGRSRKSIEQARKEGLAVGLTLISTEYKNAKSPLLWRCEAGHEVLELQKDIVRGRTCRVCRSQRKPSIQDLRDAANRRGGTCLSEKYIGATKHYTWKCHVEGHAPWSATWHSIIRGSWCARCYEDRRKSKKTS